MPEALEREDIGKLHLIVLWTRGPTKGVMQADELTQQGALARIVKLSAADEAQPLDADLVGVGGSS